MKTFWLLGCAALVIMVASCRNPEPSASPELKPGKASLPAEFKAQEAEFGGVAFVLVPPGEFVQGGIRGNGAEPLRRVKISSAIWLSKYEISQEQWMQVMGENPSNLKDNKLPVESISLLDAREFCRRFAERAAGVYRLPTEAEWEHACFLDSTGGAFGKPDGLDMESYCWYRANSDDTTHAIGTKQAGALGFHDLLGNVSEWCVDTYMGYGDAQGVVIDPVERPESVGKYDSKIARGGSCISLTEECTYFYRDYYSSDMRMRTVGMRMVREVEPAKQ